MIDLELGQEKHRMSLGHLVVQKVKPVLKNVGAMRKGHRGQFEGAPNAQIWRIRATK